MAAQHIWGALPTRSHGIPARPRPAAPRNRSDLKAELKTKIARAQEANPAFKPRLTIVQVGDRDDSAVYIRMKIRGGAEVRLPCFHPAGRMFTACAPLSPEALAIRLTPTPTPFAPPRRVP